MGQAIRSVLMLSLAFLLVSCSAVAAPRVSASSEPAPTSAKATTSGTPMPAPARPELAQALPVCRGMQRLQQPVQFDWPNLDEHRQEFSRSQWTYYACEQPAVEVAGLYRQQLTAPLYGMEETNWLERPEGTLGVFFAQTGAWQYIWFVPQPQDSAASYLIIAATFAYVEC